GPEPKVPPLAVEVERVPAGRGHPWLFQIPAPVLAHPERLQVAQRGGEIREVVQRPASWAGSVLLPWPDHPLRHLHGAIPIVRATPQEKEIPLLLPGVVQFSGQPVQEMSHRLALRDPLRIDPAADEAVYKKLE